VQQRTGQKYFHLPEKHLIRETFLSYAAEEVQRDANLKVWVSKYERCDTELFAFIRATVFDRMPPACRVQAGRAQ